MKYTKVTREVSKTIFLDGIIPNRRGSINAKATYEAEVEQGEDPTEVSRVLGLLADADAEAYLKSEITKIKRQFEYEQGN